MDCNVATSLRVASAMQDSGKGAAEVLSRLQCFFVLARCPQYFPMLCCLSLWQASAAAAAALAARTKKKRTAKAWVPKILAEALHQHRCIPGFHFFPKHIHRIVRARWLGKCTLCLTRCRRINTSNWFWTRLLARGRLCYTATRPQLISQSTRKRWSNLFHCCGPVHYHQAAGQKLTTNGWNRSAGQTHPWGHGTRHIHMPIVVRCYKLDARAAWRVECLCCVAKIMLFLFESANLRLHNFFWPNLTILFVKAQGKPSAIMGHGQKTAT